MCFISLMIDVLLNVFVKSSAEIELRSICLDVALSFTSKHVYDRFCDSFNEKKAEEFFRGGRTTCHTRCQIKLTSSSYMYTSNYLEFVSMVFDSYNYSRRTGCSYAHKANFNIDCSHLEMERLGIFWNSVCKESNAECSKWDNLCVCHCDRGYLMHGGHCVNGHHSNSKAIVQTENQESSRKNIGAILGALFGGLVLGLIIATGIGFIMYRKFRSNIQKRAVPQIMFSINDTHNRDDDTIKQDKQKRVLNVSPLTRSEKSPENRNTSGKQPAVTATDDVYNHLNEIKETQDEDTYDHACAASVSGHANDSGNYSNHHGLDNDFAMSGGTGIDDYSILENN